MIFLFLHIEHRRPCSIFCYIRNGFPINLQGCGPVKFYGDFVAGMYRNHVLMQHMLALEYTWEHTKGAQSACAMEHY